MSVRNNLTVLIPLAFGWKENKDFESRFSRKETKIWIGKEELESYNLERIGISRDEKGLPTPYITEEWSFAERSTNIFKTLDFGFKDSKLKALPAKLKHDSLGKK